MKWLSTFLIFILFCSTGCDFQKQKDLQEKETALNRKEQELFLKEKTLQIREQAILQKEKKIDSAFKKDTIKRQDTAHLYDPAIIGVWTVRMTCTETTCTGSAVGDTKTEQWDISYQNNQVVVKAMTGDKLVRIYTGLFTDNTFELIENSDSTFSETDTKMVVRLRIIDNLKMEGQREIVRSNDCKVIYALQLEKQK